MGILKKPCSEARRLLTRGSERIAVLLYRCYIVHESVVFELRAVLRYSSVSDARAKSNP